MYNSDGTLSRTEFDDDNDGTTNRTETYSYDGDGNRIRTDFDTDNDDTIDRREAYTYNPDNTLSRTDFDTDGNDTIDLSEAYTYNPGGILIRTNIDTDGDGDLDLVEYEGDVAYSGDFPNHAGLELVRLGEAGTELTIPDAFVFAGNGDPATPVRIEGGGVDTLRFDMDDFTREHAHIGRHEYWSFAADDGTWSFLVDVDVELFDI